MNLASCRNLSVAELAPLQSELSLRGCVLPTPRHDGYIHHMLSVPGKGIQVFARNVGLHVTLNPSLRQYFTVIGRKESVIPVSYANYSL